MIDIFLDPLVWVAFALLLTMLFALLGKRCLRCLLLSSLSLGLLVAIASPSFANRWLASVENTYALRGCDVAANTRPVVVLAGGLAGGYRSFPLAQRLSNSSKNRALAVVETVKPDGLLFVSGGMAPSRNDDAEADAMVQLIRPRLSTGVKVISEIESANTFESAVNLDEMFGQMSLQKDILLVTSAYHMPRAVGVFHKRGFDVCTYAVDPLQQIGVPLTAIWPRVSALRKTDVALHEWLGWLFYRQKGYL